MSSCRYLRCLASFKISTLLYLRVNWFKGLIAPKREVLILNKCTQVYISCLRCLVRLEFSTLLPFYMHNFRSVLLLYIQLYIAMDTQRAHFPSNFRIEPGRK